MGRVFETLVLHCYWRKIKICLMVICKLLKVYANSLNIIAMIIRFFWHFCSIIHSTIGIKFFQKLIFGTFSSKTHFLWKFKRWLWSTELANFCSQGVKRSVMNRAIGNICIMKYFRFIDVNITLYSVLVLKALLPMKRIVYKGLESDPPKSSPAQDYLTTILNFHWIQTYFLF